MATTFDEWEEILERLDMNFSDFPDMATLILRLEQVLGRGASMHQVGLTVTTLQIQRQRVVDSGFIISTFKRRGANVTQLLDARGRFVASTELAINETRSVLRRRVGDIAAAIRRGAG